MKKFRKGFTLVELLIVIAVLGSLSAAMTMSSTTATAKAKAASIVNNLKICTSGATIYNFEHVDDKGLKDITTTAMLAEAVPSFTKFTAVDNNDTDTVLYAAVDTTTGPAGWTVTVTLNGTDKSDIVDALKTFKGFKGTVLTAVTDADYVITYTILTETVAGAPKS